MSIARAISDAHGPLEEAMLKAPPKNVGHGLRGLLEQLLIGARDLHFSRGLLGILGDLPPAELRALTSVLITDEDIRDHFSASIAMEALNRAQQGGARLPAILAVTSFAIPPHLSRRFLADASSSYLHCLDRPCIAMCRGAVESIVESVWPNAAEEIPALGKAVRRLRDSRVVTDSQARDMWFINDQAKEVLHDEPAAEPLDAAQCLIRLGSLISDLYPHAPQGAV